ncbi:RNA recognition motif domain-containing protein [Elusimicrobiota bacterium]
MGKRLYVGNLPYSTTEEELRTTFSSIGQVESVKLITDKFTGRSKGFGFVEMAEEAAAQEAITKLNKTRMGERDLTVNEAKPMGSRDNNRRGGGGFGGGRDSNRDRSFNRY